MNQGYLSDYFEGVAVKRLSSVETNSDTSNQHEINGVSQLKIILGTERTRFLAKFIYMGENEDETIVDDDFVTWYDARENHPTRSEHRLYYPSTSVSELAEEGDLLIVARLSDGSVMIIVVRAGVSFENNILWLFNLQSEREHFRFSVRQIENENNPELSFAVRVILSELGIETERTDENYLEVMLERFGGNFPSTRVFSAFARETISDVYSLEQPDKALIAWMDQEELLFRTLERYQVAKRIQDGFADVDTFISFSLSVQNRRKSRVGFALENHLEQALIENSILYSRGETTENKAKPDFLFPGIQKYRASRFPEAKLTMLGVKSTCKDRWRQVLVEAVRIPEKHLLTLEPGISTNQTDEMIANALQLVVPESLHPTYKEEQQLWLMSLGSFFKLVQSRQTY